MNRGKMPAEKTIREFWTSKLIELDKFECNDDITTPDSGKLPCFACGYFGHCDRCHILALCEGGNNSLENIHMLCETCHQDSEYLSGDQYWIWFNARKHEDTFISFYLNKKGVNLSALISKETLYEILGKILEVETSKKSATTSTGMAGREADSPTPGVCL